ncbi:Uncharacterised protein [Segatella copri]|nr:Uncharacterised protein [Segatella copri]
MSTIPYTVPNTTTKAQNGILLSKVVHNIAAMATNAIAPVTS